MPILQTPKDLGLAIRSRRKELGWDQAKLASQIGVTRQWVIDIEKGKPRAELELAMRALRVLGMSLTVEARPPAAPMSGGHGNDRQANVGTPDLDIDAIVERNRRSHMGSAPATDYIWDTEAVNQLSKLAGSNVSLAASTALSRLAELANPKLPKTATDHMREAAASSQLSKLAGLNGPPAASSALSRLAELANPRLPKTATDYMREIEAANRLSKLAGPKYPGSKKP